MITKIIRIIFYPILILIFYTMLISYYPSIGDKIDGFIGSNFNENLRTKSNDIIGKMNIMKSETNDVIDGVGSNTKNRTNNYRNNLNEIKGK